MRLSYLLSLCGYFDKVSHNVAFIKQLEASTCVDIETNDFCAFITIAVIGNNSFSY